MGFSESGPVLDATSEFQAIGWIIQAGVLIFNMARVIWDFAS